MLNNHATYKASLLAPAPRMRVWDGRRTTRTSAGRHKAPVCACSASAPRNGELHTALSPIPTSKVTGSGTATVHLKGNQTPVTIKTQGLLADAPHAQHFHIGAEGRCPPASAAKQHNGQLSLNTTEGLPFYGKIGASLTTTGDTGADHSALAGDRFPKGASHAYHRTITVNDETAKSLRNENAVVVHGIDFNGNDTYDNMFGPSDLDPAYGSTMTPTLTLITCADWDSDRRTYRSHLVLTAEPATSATDRTDRGP